MIRLKEIQKSFPLGNEKVQILKGISLEIEAGDYVAIMGPSGSGKSTLMNIIGLLDQFDSGTFILDGKEVSGLSPDALAVERRATLGFVFQQFNLLPRMTATENVALPLLYSIQSLPREPALALLKQVGLEDRVDHEPNQLSGGQQQRVAIARALINRPKIILADEPTGNLDSKSSAEILALLQKLNQEGITIIMVTHEADVAKEAKRVITIRDGAISDDQRTSPLPVHSLHSKETGHHLESHRAQYAHLELFKQAFQTLRNNALRTVLSTLGVLIGVAAVIAMLAIGKGARESIENQLTGLGSNLLNIRSANVRLGGVTGSSGRLRITIEDAEAIEKNLSGIKKSSPYVQEGGKYITFEDKNWVTTVYGVLPGYLEMHVSLPSQGRAFTSIENQERALVAIIGVAVSHELFGEENPVGKTIKINKVPFEVIGILPEKGGSGPMSQDDRVLVPLNTAMYRLFGQTYVDVIEVELEKTTDADQSQNQIDELLRARHNVPLSMRDEPFRIMNMAELKQALSETSRTMSALLLAIAAISLLVGGIGIMNIMLVSVTERTKEIGLRKAIGGTSADILLQFLVESAAIGTIGGAIGAILGVSTSFLVTYLGGWKTSISVASIVGAFLFASLIGIIFGIWPAKRAAKLNPIEALRS